MLAIIVLVVCGVVATSTRLKAQVGDQTAASGGNQEPFELKVGSNLVVVRVVVRDAHGRPVENLRKEDFQLFDNGKEQAISQFAVETPTTTEAPNPGQPTTPELHQVPAPAVLPERFLALYFDDLDMSPGEIGLARDAADRYLAASLEPSERVGIFASSGLVAAAFTSDLKQLHEALSRLRSSPLFDHSSDCPELSDYQAEEIVQNPDDITSDAWKLAIDDANNRCHMGSMPTPAVGTTLQGPPLPGIERIRNSARSVMEQYELQAGYSLKGLSLLVKYLSRMPGQRSIILVSPGFLSEKLQLQVDRIIDLALRSHVVISSMDPRGLAMLITMVDASRGNRPLMGSLGGSQDISTQQRETAVTSVLAEVADGTGGEFFHNDNDLNAGFGALMGSQGYILAFAPADLKLDGRFHSLKVTLAEKPKGVTVQARRGYFAFKSNEVADPAAEAKDELREMLAAKYDLHELPVEVATQLSKAVAGDAELSVLIHLDIAPVRFRREGERNVDDVTFAFAIFDTSGKYVTGEQKQAHLDLSDASLQKFLTTGLDIRTAFQLKPGTYTVRAVVMDSEEHRLGAVSHDVEIP